MAAETNESKDPKENKKNEVKKRPPSPMSAPPSILPSLSMSGDIEDNDIVIVSADNHPVNSNAAASSNKTDEVFSPFVMPNNNSTTSGHVTQASRTAAMRDHMNKRMSFKSDEDAVESGEEESSI